ncbi:MAG TPA: hypothetical protein VMW48_05635 [Vicinamibacterales bacterium]|nr:hypothetical protein [Vicinamibacterales bacterium]
MTVDPISNNAVSREIQREVLVAKKQQDVARDVGQSLVDLVKSAPSPGRIDTYA